MKCLNCRTENREEATFCKGCGQPLQKEIKCPQCDSSNLFGATFCDTCGASLTQSLTPAKTSKHTTSTEIPTSFANGRYIVKKKLGEGGKKKVFLAHDTVLDRDVAFALIKTENLDDAARTRITREAQAMGRLGDHPHIVTVYDYGEEAGQPYIVQPCITGGDVEDLIKKTPDHKVPIDEVIKIGQAVCQGLIFSHNQGIIHRDLKPGNVMLTSDGTAKICDFGLAIAVDMSRLTMSGMMVGTVSYMPPEQAMGGQISEKADLYSLGAMLYEMVTGRPPFIGDDSVSIIGQHINTTPVAPSWHRADLPQALETLILQLLEKDPGKRPASAQVVLEALESIEIGKTEKEPSVQSPTLADSPLYRRVFVGRELELKQLQSAFNSAMSGQGALMMVVGEPGIGKTALTEQVATWVKLRGGRTLVGHCYEEGSLSLPYLAFVEAMRTYVLSREADDLKSELGTNAADVARIVSEIREKLRIHARPKADPEEERYRLMQGVSDFLCHAANIQPMLIVLEDLHDADKGTLDMLTHVSRNLAGSRLLIVGTYRDVEVDRSHPLSAALAELRRLATYGRVILRGLNADEVRRMLEDITHEEVPWSLAEAVHRQTEGNPLFVQEVIRYLVEEGLITQQEGHWRPTKDTPVEMNIPEGLRDVIGKRLSLLSVECNSVLSNAAVIGREFTLETLKGVVDVGEATFVTILKEAVQLAVLEERPQVGEIRYRFTHAFFRQTLYEELIAPERLKLHQQVARVLEKQYDSRLEEHATELAEHFSQSTDPSDLKKAVEYSEMAAKRAIDVYAYGEAVRLLEQAIKVQKVLDRENHEKLCDLLLGLANVLIIGAEPTQALNSALPEAFSLAEGAGDHGRASRSCVLAMLAGVNSGSVTMASWGSQEMARWVERADRYAGDDPVARAWADQGLGQVKFVTGFYSNQPDLMLEGFRLIDKVFRATRSTDNSELWWFISATWIIYSSPLKYAQERHQLLEEMIKRSRHSVSLMVVGAALFFMFHVALESGERQRAETLAAEVNALAERSGQVNLIGQALCVEAILATLDGRLEAAEQVSQKIRTLFQERGLETYGGVVEGIASNKALILLGKAQEAVAIYDSIGIEVTFWHARFLADLGRTSEAQVLLDQFLTAYEHLEPDEYLERAWGYQEIPLLAAAIQVGHRRAVEWMMGVSAKYNVPTTGIHFATCINRVMGAGAAFLGKYDEACKYYQEAIRVCTKIPFRPELALSKLQFAELLLTHYPKEKKQALEHLDFAIKEFREMKMQPSLERALRHKDILKA